MFGLNLNFTAILAAVCALLVAACTFLWWRLDVKDAALDKAEAALDQEKSNAKIVTQYVDRIVKIPGPPIIRDRLVRGVCHAIDLPSPGGADAAAGADAGAGRIDPDALAADLAAAQRNKVKLEALQEVLRPQL